MENGATIMLRSSWALNTLDVREAVTSVCGTKAGGDMFGGGVTINGVKNDRQYRTDVCMTAGGAAFYEGLTGDNPETREARPPLTRSRHTASQESLRVSISPQRPAISTALITTEPGTKGA